MKGRNPFADFTVDGTSLANIVRAYDAPYITSTYVYDHIQRNIDGWVEGAIAIRSSY